MNEKRPAFLFFHYYYQTSLPLHDITFSQSRQPLQPSQLEVYGAYDAYSSFLPPYSSLPPPPPLLFCASGPQNVKEERRDILDWFLNFSSTQKRIKEGNPFSHQQEN